MKIWAISDLHLSFSRPKPMDVFGEHWHDHAARVAASWRDRVAGDDVVCLPGDLSWALRLSEAREELRWLGSLPGRKVLIRGNHDYWWPSISRLRAALPEGVHAIQNDSVRIGEAWFAGSRGWVDASLRFAGLCPAPPGEGGAAGALEAIRGPEEDERIYRRELARLEASLRSAGAGARLRVALLHFPPTSPELEDTPVTRLLERHGVDVALFGHLHRTGPGEYENPFGVKAGVVYHLVSADFVGFAPQLVAEVAAETDARGEAGPHPTL